MTQKNIHKIFIPQKNIQFFENPKKYWNSEFWTQKNGPILRMCENIRVPPWALSMTLFISTQEDSSKHDWKIVDW